MASNFKNSAGTDLDSLFLVNNQNAGAIGFKISDGTDLGNRYSNATPKLGQTTGYKNNAGTDLGNLRSNKKPASTGNITLTDWYGREVKGSTTIDGVKINFETVGSYWNAFLPKEVSTFIFDSKTFTYDSNNPFNEYKNQYRYKYYSPNNPLPAGTYSISFTI